MTPRPRRPRGRPRKNPETANAEAELNARTAQAAAAAALQTGTPSEDGSGDPPPGPPRRRRGRPPGSSNKATKTAQIEAALARLLALPAYPFAFTGDPFMVQHFETRAPALAHALAQQSETNPGLRRALERIALGDANFGLVGAAVLYLLPPLMYFNVVPVPQAAANLLGVPDREEVRQPSVIDLMNQVPVDDDVAAQAAQAAYAARGMGVVGHAEDGTPIMGPVANGDGSFSHPPQHAPGAHTV